MSKRPLQYFSDDYLESCKEMSPTQICVFLDNFRVVAAANHVEGPRKLISLRVREPVLSAFKQKAKRHGIPYQRQIQLLMESWLEES